MENFDSEQLVEALSLIIKESGGEAYKFPPFDSWEELKAAREEHGLDEPPRLDGHYSDNMRIALSCINAFHLYLGNLAFAYFVRLTVRKQRNPKNQSGFTLASGIAADVGAIGLLCREGFDIQAKQILRSLREKVDCLIAVQLDRSFAVQFVASDGSEEANDFWRKRIARGRLKKLISNRLKKLSRMTRSPLDEEWFRRRASFERWLGEAVHPSHTTGLLSAFPNYGLDTESFGEVGWVGTPSDLSIPTIRSVLALAFEIDLLVHWRNLIEADDFQIADGDGEEGIFFSYHQRLEGFVRQCTANSMIKPNFDVFRLYAWIGGRMIVRDGEEPDPKSYEREMIEIFTRLLEGAIDGLATRLEGHRNGPSVTQPASS